MFPFALLVGLPISVASSPSELKTCDGVCHQSLEQDHDFGIFLQQPYLQQPMWGLPGQSLALISSLAPDLELVGTDHRQDSPWKKKQQVRGPSSSADIAHVDNQSYDFCAMLCSVVLIMILAVVFRFVSHRPGSHKPLKQEGRSHLLDNAKCLAVIFVAFTHTRFPQFGQARPWNTTLLIHTYSPLHTATFCFISGLMSRGEFKASKIIVFCLAPILAFCFVIEPLDCLDRRMVWGYGCVMNPFQSLFQSGMQPQWYLFSLIWWRLLGHVFRHLSAPWKMVVAIIISAQASYWDVTFLSLPIALRLFPIFIAGQVFPYDQAVSRITWRPITAILGLIVLPSIQYGISLSPLLTGTFSFTTVPPETNSIISPMQWPLFWVRNFAQNLLTLVNIMIVLFFVCPREEHVFTATGRCSLYPYLLHKSLIPWLGWWLTLDRWVKDAAVLPAACKVLVTSLDMFIMFLVCVVLASWPVRSVYGWILEPTWLQAFLNFDIDKPKDAHPGNGAKAQSPRDGSSIEANSIADPKGVLLPASK